MPINCHNGHRAPLALGPGHAGPANSHTPDCVQRDCQGWGQSVAADSGQRAWHPGERSGPGSHGLLLLAGWHLARAWVVFNVASG